MKKHICFLLVLWSVASHCLSVYAANFSYQVEPIGTSQYVIRLNSDEPHPFGMMLEGVKQKAQEICQGQYQLLQIDPGTTQNILVMIECLSLNGRTPFSTRREEPVRQEYALPTESNRPYQLQRQNSMIGNEFSLANRFGIGYLANLTSIDILGPMVEYWLTDYFGVSSKFGISINLIDYFYSLRGNLLIGNPIVMGGPIAKFYVGAGYLHFGTFDNSLDEDNGAEVYGGLMINSNIIEKLYIRCEAGAFVWDFSDDYDYKQFNVGVGVSYIF